MCEFCHQHGEGKKWYLQAENYSQDLKSDLWRRMKIPDEDSLGSTLSRQGFRQKQYQQLDQRPKWLQGVLRPYLSRYMLSRAKKVHYGQVLPIEDVEQVFDIVNSIVRVACFCRQSTLGTDERYCYGVSLGPPPELAKELDASYDSGPDTSDLERLAKEEALDLFREHAREGCLHTIWTLPSPFIVGICNCDRWECGALRSTLGDGLNVLFKAEYVAQVDPELCNGCRQCMRVCQYGALGCSAALKKVMVDPMQCAGCGICRMVCKQDAISLSDRSAHPVAAAVW
jgi:ferredoxin